MRALLASVVLPAALACLPVPKAASAHAPRTGDAGGAAAKKAAIAPATSEALAPSVFAARRARLLERLGEDATVVLFAAPVVERNHDVSHPYRQASDFWYLTGFPEPAAAALITRRDGKPSCTLFVPESDRRAELWDGRRLGVDGARPLADEVLGARELEGELRRRLEGRPRVLASFGGDASRRELLARCVGREAALDERALRDAVGRLRLVKEPEELALLQRAIEITCAALRHAMRHAEPGLHEFELQAVIEGSYLLMGSPRPGFPSIVGSGRSSCILHYDTNRELVPPQRTIVIDVGAEFGMYSADVTRTLPSSGRFTPEQRIVYQAVLDAQKAGIEAAKPGATLGAIGRVARDRLAEELVKGGVIGSAAQVRAVLPHGVCHWLGLDVHDECPYEAEDGRGEVRLEPGMVTTVEPGCYIPAGAPGIDPRWHEIGVRIEDDVLITADGCIVLSAGAPREIEEVERAMAEESLFPRLLESR